MPFGIAWQARQAADVGPLPAPADGLPAYLSPPAAQLLVGVSVYREPIGRNAVLFQIGELSPGDAEPTAGGPGTERLPRSAPGSALAGGPVLGIGPALTPRAPYQPPANLAELVSECEVTGLLTVSKMPRGQSRAAGDIPPVFVEPRTAAALHRELLATGRGDEVTRAHQRAAEYWQWRATAWPQDQDADVHDLLEARHHQHEAGGSRQAIALTEMICSQLHAWGQLDREAILIRETMAWLPARSPQRASWIQEIGKIAQVREDYTEARRRYQQSLEIYARAGDASGVSRSHHLLGVLAQAQGDYAEAERRYQQSSSPTPATRQDRKPGPGRRAGPSGGSRLAQALVRRAARGSPPAARQRARGPGAPGRAGPGPGLAWPGDPEQASLVPAGAGSAGTRLPTRSPAQDRPDDERADQRPSSKNDARKNDARKNDASQDGTSQPGQDRAARSQTSKGLPVRIRPGRGPSDPNQAGLGLPGPRRPGQGQAEPEQSSHGPAAAGKPHPWPPDGNSRHDSSLQGREAFAAAPTYAGPLQDSPSKFGSLQDDEADTEPIQGNGTTRGAPSPDSPSQAKPAQGGSLPGGPSLAGPSPVNASHDGPSSVGPARVKPSQGGSSQDSQPFAKPPQAGLAPDGQPQTDASRARPRPHRPSRARRFRDSSRQGDQPFATASPDALAQGSQPQSETPRTGPSRDGPFQGSPLQGNKPFAAPADPAQSSKPQSGMPRTGPSLAGTGGDGLVQGGPLLGGKAFTGGSHAGQPGPARPYGTVSGGPSLGGKARAGQPGETGDGPARAAKARAGQTFAGQPHPGKARPAQPQQPHAVTDPVVRRDLADEAQSRTAGDHTAEEHAAAEPTLGRGRVLLAGAATLAAAAALVAGIVTGALPGPQGAHRPTATAPRKPASPGSPAPGSQAPTENAAAQIRSQTAAWAVHHLSRGNVVTCDPAMCAALVQHGFPEGNLLTLNPAVNLSAGDIVIATAAVRNMFGDRLTTVFAPEIEAALGSGSIGIQIRVVAPEGARAYRVALRLDVARRRQAGTILSRNSRITATPAARQALTGGRVDSRLLSILPAMANAQHVHILSFGAAPGASPGMPMCSMDISLPVRHKGHGPPGGQLHSALSFLAAQQPPYRVMSERVIRRPGRPPVLQIEFGGPGPLGLLSGGSLDSMP